MIVTFRSLTLLSCLAMMTLVATAHPAPAAKKGSAVVVQISGRLDATVDAVTDPRCIAQGYTLSGTPEKGAGAIYKGTLVGVGGFCNQVKPPFVDASGGYYRETHTFVGTVRGCGTGTFRYTLDGVLHPLDVGKEYSADEDWSIEKGSGTGDLVGIRSGLNHRTGGFTKEGTPFAVFDPAMNRLTCIPTQR